MPIAPGVLQQIVRGRDAARRVRRAAAVAAVLVLRERQQRQVLLAPLLLRARRLLLPLPAPSCSGLGSRAETRCEQMQAHKSSAAVMHSLHVITNTPELAGNVQTHHAKMRRLRSAAAASRSLGKRWMCLGKPCRAGSTAVAGLACLCESQHIPRLGGGGLAVLAR